MDNTINSLVSKAVGYTDQQVKDYFLSNPNLTDAQIFDAMKTFGVSPYQIATATGTPLKNIMARIAPLIPYGSSAMLGDVVVTPQYQLIGEGQDQQVGPLQALIVSKSNGDINYKAPVGSEYQQYAPDGTFQRTGTISKVDTSLGGAIKDIVSNPGFQIAALAYGGNALGNALGGSTLGSLGAVGSDLAGLSGVAGGTGALTAAESAALYGGGTGLTSGSLSGLTSGSSLSGLTGGTLGASNALLGDSVLGSTLAGTTTGLTGSTLAGLGAGGSLLTAGAGGAAGSALGTTLGQGLAASALGNVAGGLANQSGITDARNLINQYGGQAGTNLVSAYKDAQGLNTANRTDLGNVYSNLNTNLNNTLNAEANLYGQTNTNLYNNYSNTLGNMQKLYNQQVGYQQPYQDIGVQGSKDLIANNDYFQHQFNANDLNTNLAPNYAFQLAQGQMANQRAGNAAGGALGGNALQGLQRYTQDYAGGAYQNAFNNYNTQRNNIYNSLKGMADIGTTSSGQLASLGNTLGGNLGSLSSNYAGNMLSNAGQLQTGYNQYGSNLTNAANAFGGNLTTSAGQGINAANAYGLNTANLATGIGSALASNATQTGANNASMLSNLGNTALLGSMLKAT
jgi:hypothetical protein